MSGVRDAFPVPEPTAIVDDIPVSGMKPLTQEEEDAERKAERTIGAQQAPLDAADDYNG